MENIAALKSAANAPADSKRPVSSGGVDDALFAAFVVNIDTVKPQEDRPAPRPAPKAEQNSNKAVADKPEQPVRKAEKAGEKQSDAIQDDDENESEEPVVKADAPKAAPVAKKDKPAEKVECKKDDDSIVVAPEEDPEIVVDAPVAKVKEFSLPEQASDVAVVKTAEAHSKHDEIDDTTAIANPVIQLVVHEEKHEGNSKKNDLAAALADNIANTAPETSAPAAAKEQAASKAANTLQNIAANDDKAADDADFDAAVDAILATIANTEAKNAKAVRASNSATNDAAKPLGDVVQNLVAGGSQASPLLSGQAIGQNQPALPHSFQAGATSATSPSSDIIARPIGLAVQQLESSKTGEVRLAKLPARTAEQVQEQVALKLRYAAKAGEKSVSIQLRPDDLGRVDIKLDFKEGNQVNAKITADTQVALDILKRDAVGMERVLNDAGLQLEENGLQFSLRDNGSEQAGKRGFKDAMNSGSDADWDDNADDYVAIEANPTPSIAGNGRVNIVI